MNSDVFQQFEGNTAIVLLMLEVCVSKVGVSLLLKVFEPHVTYQSVVVAGS
jgi:hypothetical protein